MKNQITFKGGLALMAMSLIFLSSCKKEQSSLKKPVKESENQAPEHSDFKFTAVAKVVGERPEQGYLNLLVSSDDQEFLNKYVAKLESTKVVFVESDPNSSDINTPTPLMDDPSGAVKIHFDWTHFTKGLEKGKMYAMYMQDKNAKSLINLGSISNLTSFTTSGGYACVNLLNTTSWTTDCFCNPTVNWRFYNAANSQFCNQVMSSGSNFEIRTFSGYSSSPWNFSIGGTTVYYQPRYNFSGTLITGTLSDYNAIYKGDNYLVPSPHLSGKATATFYIAG